jgi:large subunit ribosomal protein L32
MGALPKQRVSRHRQGNRRRYHVLKPLALVSCRNCREIKMAHHVCPNCGYYRGRQVVVIEERDRDDD